MSSLFGFVMAFWFKKELHWELQVGPQGRVSRHQLPAKPAQRLVVNTYLKIFPDGPSTQTTRTQPKSQQWLLANGKLSTHRFASWTLRLWISRREESVGQ